MPLRLFSGTDIAQTVASLMFGTVGEVPSPQVCLQEYRPLPQ